MLRYLIVLTLVIGMFAGAAQAQEAKGELEGGGVVYGPNYAYTISAPEGWILDNESGQELNLQAVFYPEGSTWYTAEVLMYATRANKGEGFETIEKIIEDDVSQFEERNPDIKVFDSEPLLTGRNEKALVRYYQEDNKQYDAVAYVDEPKVVIMLVFTAKNKGDFDKYLPVFKELVSSCYYLTDSVKFMDSKKEGEQ